MYLYFNDKILQTKVYVVYQSAHAAISLSFQQKKNKTKNLCTTIPFILR